MSHKILTFLFTMLPKLNIAYFLTAHLPDVVQSGGKSCKICTENDLTRLRVALAEANQANPVVYSDIANNFSQ